MFTLYIYSAISRNGLNSYIQTQAIFLRLVIFMKHSYNLFKGESHSVHMQWKSSCCSPLLSYWHMCSGAPCTIVFISAILLGNAKVSVALNLINDSSGLPDDTTVIVLFRPLLKCLVVSVGG